MIGSKIKNLVSIVMAVIIGGAVTYSAWAQNSKTEIDSATGKWNPQNEIEFVVPSAPGGGSDTNARIISDIAFKSGYSPVNFKVNNMPGGSGAVAFSYMATKPGENDILMVLHNGQIMSTLTNNSPVIANDLTYLPVVAFDNLLLCRQTNGKYADVNTMIEAAKESPGKINIGGSQRGNSDHLSFELMQKYLGIDISYVQYNSSGEVMSALLGGHVDFGIFNPSECAGQVEAKEVVPVATFATERLTGIFEEAPTFEELGYPDIQFLEVRALSGPPEMAPEAIAFYDEMILQVTQDPRWMDEYITKNYLTPAYMTSEEARVFFEAEIEKYLDIFRTVGLIE